ncbi:uncharacterized protein ACHE_40746A [Aspergillus chevalieri]|uniref:Uncharacterized protein n=1 Tax=Aspergillus chevalieri TaxID=182096 RepID=A0A7R7VP04_ASPCH|nr:uncharacterized protein ACHE_40746A [Aspergillus chevalieri]BCR88182.1 hypothetical protein ACHE_40746A [Aspergillus chevalieri]
MAAHAVTTLPTSTTGLPIGEEVQEYEKILRISDEIFSGTHPKLKVPQQFVRKTTSRNPPTQAQVVNTGGLDGSPTERPSQATPSAAPAPTTITTASVHGPSDVTATTPSKNRTVPKPTSEIDPIFLTKSDDLVRAELQLQRQRVERVLRDQLEQKRLESRQKAAMQDAKPDFDVSDVLNQALELVKPASVNDISTSNVAGAPSDSFDENSFYSSRAPDSPQQGEPPSAAAAAAAPLTGDLATKIPVENFSDELQRLEALNRTGSDQEMRDAYPVADQRDPYRHRQPYGAPVDLTSNKYHEVQQPEDAMEEPDYSPPAPGVLPMDRAVAREYQPEYVPHDARRRVENRGGYYNPMSPRDDVRIVRNHITSPAAPQPSRVSPLAVAKVPSAPQAKDMRTRYGPEQVHSAQNLDRGSPDVPAAQHPMPRKRRRLQEDKGRARQVSYNKKPAAVDSSDPYIKEEPVSPPPFADALPAYQGRSAQPVYIDIASPRYTPVIERREPSIREPVYEPDPYHEAPMPRAASRLSSRRPMRDEPDLRRVASLQNARQPEYAREYVEQQPSPRAVRAASYAVERPPPERATRYYDEPVPAYSRRFVPAEGSPSSPQFREAYYEEEPVPVRLMPPPRRIVVDEHGNQYYEAAPAVQYVPSAGRVPRSDVYDDGAPVRQASMRAASIIEDPYGGRKYVQEMPPPPSTYRRVTDYARPAPVERRPYATPLEGEQFTRSSSVQVGEYARRPAYVEEPGLPRERLVRMPSVRPQTARYDEPREVIPRVASVRPGSVYMDEDPQRPREYVERPVYVSRPPPMREDQAYYEGEPERVMMEGGRNVVQRAPLRY